MMTKETQNGETNKSGTHRNLPWAEKLHIYIKSIKDGASLIVTAAELYKHWDEISSLLHALTGCLISNFQEQVLSASVNSPNSTNIAPKLEELLKLEAEYVKVLHSVAFLLFAHKDEVVSSGEGIRSFSGVLDEALKSKMPVTAEGVRATIESWLLGQGVQCGASCGKCKRL